MNRDRISEILETYRPGQGLESDPEVRQALELAAADPELGEQRRRIDEFDRAVAAQLRSIPVPAELQARILQAARARPAAPARRNPLIAWFHPAAFAAAAAIVILLALTFTFRGPAGPAETAAAPPQMALADGGLMQTAHALYASLRPSFKSGDGNAIVDYLKSRGSTVPVSLPGNVDWSRSFACDVVEVNDTKVSIICFMAPDNSRTMHLFTFHRSAFPDFTCTGRPSIHKQKDCCCAAWGDGEHIHVLFSDKGEENLRKVLEI